MSEWLDCIVIGAGVVGLAAGRVMACSGSVAVLEQHDEVGTEITSRNSGVLHAGLYYPQQSLKNRLCIAGRQQLVTYCQEHQIDHRLCGKLVLATDDSQLPALQALIDKARSQGVALSRLSRAEVREREPLVSCVAAAWSPMTGIIDVGALVLQLQADIERQGGFVLCRQRVTRIVRHANGFRVDVHGQAPVYCHQLINTAGFGAAELASDLVDNAPKVYPVKGHYFSYQGHSPFAHLIYPMPEPGNLGLGIHATMDLNGRTRFGPDTLPVDTLDYRVPERFKASFAEAIQRYYPALDVTRLHADYAGIRPKLSVDQFTDFRIDGPRQHGIPGLVNLYGIESPGLTASMAIADYVDTLLA
ncbi:L-2-hydroxyglutarate oxidase LhgO [BD1-7 clade bacterium]|uniref:L-2-hydroxyglutarate oxidase LhgO n=1 Tax=BD1-7 clade bacterium TaxID=2029982 RepID=A0A5S9N010_9GAMM|nr:L-2-hydroxyglutarate oxidase LhgO [BD1-7 clade bacterium]